MFYRSYRLYTCAQKISILLCCFIFSSRKQQSGLGDQHSRHHQSTAGNLRATHDFAQKQPARYGPKDSLKTHDDRRWSRICIFLSNNLQRKRHSAGHNTAIKDGKPSRRNRLPANHLKQQCSNTAAKPTDKNLGQCAFKQGR